MGRFGTGQAVRRVEDQRFLTGGGRYTDDISLAGQLRGHVLRSPYGHARILGIDTTAARAMPGVAAVLTSADLAGIGGIPVGFKPNSRDGTKLRPPHRPILADGRVLHAGEAVAFVVAETAEQARDAAEAILVDYDPLPAVTALDAAIAADAPLLWDHLPGNVAFDWDLGDATATDAAFAAAARVVSLTLVNNRVVPTPLEPRGALGAVEDGRLTLYSGSQGSHGLKDDLIQVLGLAPDGLRVVSPDVGGGFGLRLFLFPEHVLVLHAARLLARPVKWIGDRSEAFLADTHGRDHLSRAELALDGDGRVLALRVDTLANLGGYVSQYGAFVPTAAGSKMLAGVYAFQALHVRVRGIMTNTAPVDAYRGAGRPEAAYLVERLMDAAGRETGLGPVEIRRRNFIAPAAMPYRTAGGITYDSGDFAGTLDEALRRADWNGFPARRAEAAARGRLRGIGLASYIEACGGGSGEDCAVRVEPDGGITVLIGTQSSGQGHETAYAQMVAAELGVPVERIRVRQGDTDEIAQGGGTGGSRSIPVGGAATAQAAEKLAATARRLAAQHLGAREDELAFADGNVHVAGSNRFVSLAELARLHGLAESARFKPSAATYPNGTHVCEVEIDPGTGRTQVVRYTIVDDFGVALNPLLLAGQVYGGTAQGIGQALLEAAVYDDSGQLLSGTLMDYAIPHADDLPDFDFTTRNVPCATNPLGIKGAGEAGSIGAPPAVINAVIDALSPFGIRHIDMPATPIRVWQAIRNAKDAS